MSEKGHSPSLWLAGHSPGQAIPLLGSKPPGHVVPSQPGMHPQTKLFSSASLSFSRELSPGPGILIAPWGRVSCWVPSPGRATALSPLPSLLCPGGRREDWPEGAEPAEGLGLAWCPHICSASVFICLPVHTCTHTHTLAQGLHLFRGADGWAGRIHRFCCDPGPQKEA